MRAVFVASLLGALSLAACESHPVGNKCHLGSVVDGGIETTTIVGTPSVDCTSRMCLRTPLDQGAILPEGSEHADLCTDTCDSDDECEALASTPCVGGFTCTTATVSGPFCCEKMCVCRDYLQIPDGGLKEPAACDPGNALNTCCNLPGREALAQCG